MDGLWEEDLGRVDLNSYVENAVDRARSTC